MQSVPRAHFSKQRSPASICNHHYSVSSHKKILLSIMMLLSIILALLALKKHTFIPICVLCSLITFKLYLIIENDALSEARRMRSRMSLQQIHTAFKKPPSPKFDQHVRVKMIELIKLDAFKNTKSL